MIARLRTPHVVLLGLGSALAAMTACSSPDPGREVDGAKTTQASSVTVDMRNAAGTSLGTCMGTLVSARMVITAGHCVAGASSWLVTSGSKTVKGTAGSTPWKAFGSDLSHPEHSDVGLILLESDIDLDSYPALATKPLKDGATAQRFRRSGKSASVTSSVLELGADEGFRLNYLTDAKGEAVDPGAAVLDARGQIVGVVSGRGRTSNKLHIARVDQFSMWAKAAIECGGGGPDGLGVRTWGGGRGGTPNTGTWGSSSGGYGGGGGTSGGPGDKLLDAGPVPGSSGTPVGDTTASTSSSSSGGPGGEAGNTCPGAPKCEGECGKDGSNGTPGGSSSSSSGSPGGGTAGGGTPGGGTPGGGTPGGSSEGCSGSGDNSEKCPVAPDGPTCTGANCGGCTGVSNCQDGTMDYGSCAACSTASGGPIVK